LANENIKSRKIAKNYDLSKSNLLGSYVLLIKMLSSKLLVFIYTLKGEKDVLLSHISKLMMLIIKRFILKVNFNLES